MSWFNTSFNGEEDQPATFGGFFDEKIPAFGVNSNNNSFCNNDDEMDEEKIVNDNDNSFNGNFGMGNIVDDNDNEKSLFDFSKLDTEDLPIEEILE